MSSAENRIREFATAKNYEGLRACIELAIEYPNGEVASTLESVGLMTTGLSIFDKVKSGISSLHDTAPDAQHIKDPEQAIDELQNYGQQVIDFIKDRSADVSNAVGDRNTDELDLRIIALQGLRKEFSKDRDSDKSFARRALQKHNLDIPAEDMRKAIVIPFSWIKESLWNSVVEGRDAEIRISQGQPVDDILGHYKELSSEAFGIASEIATEAIISINKVVGSDK